jgi:hypothetical protein
MTLLIALAVALLGTVGFSPATAAADGIWDLDFIATANWPGAEGKMRLAVANGKTTLTFKVRNAAPDTVYTIWTVFNHLAPGMEKSLDTDANGNTIVRHAPDSCGANKSSSDPRCTLTGSGSWTGWAGFPVDGHGVAPTAKTSARFTDGMGLDPGATFITNQHGDSRVTVSLDYDITEEAPVGNKNVVTQRVCVPAHSTTNCFARVNITTTYLRRFIAEFPQATREDTCANYHSDADPEAPGNHAAATGEDARQWQCVDPKTGMPRIHRFGFDHFRIANHVDGLTHGFIGGNGIDHIIDLVGLRACALDADGQKLPKLDTPAGVTVNYKCPGE